MRRRSVPPNARQWRARAGSRRRDRHRRAVPAPRRCRAGIVRRHVCSIIGHRLLRRSCAPVRTSPLLAEEIPRARPSYFSHRTQRASPCSYGGHWQRPCRNILVERIAGLANVEVVTGVELSRAGGQGWPPRSDPLAQHQFRDRNATGGAAAFLLRRCRTEHRLAKAIGPEARRAGFCLHWRRCRRGAAGARNQPARRIRRGRRPRRVGQARRRCGRRWRAGGGGAPRLLCRSRSGSVAAARRSDRERTVK